MSEEPIFRKCPSCATTWNTREDFLSDALIELNGYQASLKSIEKGLFLFTHLAVNCFSTMGVPVTEFDDLYIGTRYTEDKSLSAECPRYCDDEKRLERCDVKCECAYVREILHAIKGNEHTRVTDTF